MWCETETDVMTIRAVSQDDFSDVQIPDAPVQPPRTPNVGVEKGGRAGV